MSGDKELLKQDLKDVEYFDIELTNSDGQAVQGIAFYVFTIRP